MEIDLKGLRAARKRAAGKPAEKPRVPAAPLLSELLGTESADQAAPAPAVSDEAATTQFKAPASEEEAVAAVGDPKGEGKSARAIPQETPAVSDPAEEPVEASGLIEDEVVVSDTPATFDMEAVRVMVGQLVSERLAELSATVEALKAGVFGEDMESAVNDVLEGQPLLEAFDSAMMDKVSFNDLGVEFDDEGNMVALTDEEGNPVQSPLLNMINAAHAAAAPVPAEVDLSGVEESLGEVKARLSQLEGNMFCLIADGEVLVRLGVFETDEEGNIVKDESGQPKIVASAFGQVAEHCPTLDDLDAYVQRDELGPNGELAPKMVEIAEQVMATSIVRVLVRDPLSHGDIEEIQNEAASAPETARGVLRSLASDVELVKEMIARAEGTSMEELQKPHNAAHLEQVEAKAPKVRELSEALADKLPWDVLISNRDNQSQVDGGDA